MIKNNAFLITVVGFVAVAVGLWSFALTSKHYKYEAIEQGCAQYNGKTAEFEWKNKKADKDE